MNFSSYFAWESPFLIHFWRIILLDTEIYGVFFPPFNTLNISLIFLLACIVSEENCSVIPWPLCRYSFCLFVSSFFQDFLFVFAFLQFGYYVPRCHYFDIYSAWCSLSFLDLWFGVHHFGKFPNIIISSISSFPLSLPPHTCYFWVISPHLNILIFFIFFFLAFNFGHLLTDLQALWFFTISVYWWTHKNHPFLL